MGGSEFEEAWGQDDGEEGRARRARRIGEAIVGETCASIPAQPVVTVGLDANIRLAVRTMVGHRVGSVLIVDPATGRIAGIFTERDVLTRVVARGVDLDRPVRDVMTPDPATLGPDAPIILLLNQMVDGGYRHVPIVDDEGRPITVLAVRTFAAWVVDFIREDVLNLAPRAPNAYKPEIDGG